MVLDSTRPAHVGGFAQFGTGFLFDPVPVGQWIRDAQMKLVLSAALLSIPSMQALSHRGAPIQSSRPDNAPAAKIKVGIFVVLTGPVWSWSSESKWL